LRAECSDRVMLPHAAAVTLCLPAPAQPSLSCCCGSAGTLYRLLLL
jgi:hypothetical protein